MANRPKGQRNEDVKIRFSADTKEAVRSISQFERKVNRLGDLADQGSTLQRGFLSPKQVRMYREMMKEIEQQYKKHFDKLSSMEEAYANKKKAADEKLRKHQNMLNRAEGGDGWGGNRPAHVNPNDPSYWENNVYRERAGDSIIEHHRDRIEQTMKEMDNLKSLEAEIAAMKQAVNSMASDRSRAQGHSQQIGDMNVRDPHMNDLVNGVVHGAMAGTGVIGFHNLMNYTGNGMDTIRLQDAEAAKMMQRMQSYTGSGADTDVRTDARDTGELNQFNTMDTLRTQTVLAAGGTNGNKQGMRDDTLVSQEFSRAYGIDPNLIAGSGSMLKQMGSLEEGQMRRFADLIGGSINKSKMSGREEEAIRATSALLQNVARGQAEFSANQVKNVVAMQTALGEKVPSLKGERGASLLSTMDNSIKNADAAGDILLGKGTKYQGIAGMYELQKRKEEGISNPDNLRTMLDMSDRLIADPKARNMALSSKLGISLHQVEALQQSGFFADFRAGKITNEEYKKKLEEVGVQANKDRLGLWDNSQARDQQDNVVQDEKINTKFSYAAEETGTGLGQLWHGLPDWMQLGAMGVAGAGGLMFGGKLARGAKNFLLRKMLPKVNGSGGLKGLWNSFRGGPPTGGGGGAGGLRGLLGRGVDFVSDVGGGLLKGAKQAISSPLQSVKSLASGASKLVKAMPLIGAATTVAADRLESPQHDWMRSLVKGAGSLIGGLVGTGAGVAAGVGTGGAGLVATGALAAGGSVLGEKAADSIYSYFAGEEDNRPVEAPVQQVPKETAPNPAGQGADTTPQQPRYDQFGNPVSQGDANTSGVSQMTVNSLSINDKSFADFVKGDDKYSSFGGPQSKQTITQEHIIKVSIDGKIDGVTPETEGAMKDGFLAQIKDWISGPRYAAPSSTAGLDLSKDQKRA